MRIIGHRKELATLQKSVEQGAAAQAYLFTGPRSVGKSLCALRFGALLTGDPEFVPTTEKPHPFDVTVLRPQEETKRGVTKVKSIAAESVREALSFLGHYPVLGRFRVLIIEDAHRLSETAQNVLLKTLEEPPSSAVIILVTHEVGALLSTVLSRVKRVRFGFVPAEEVHEELSGQGQDTGAVAPFFFALGRPGVVLTALKQPESFVTDKELLGSLFRLSTLTLAERLALAEKMALHTDQAVRLLEWWLPGLYQQSQRLTEKNATTRFYRLLEEGETTLRLLKTTQSNARLLLEKLFLSV